MGLGSIAVAGWAAHLVFWTVLIVGVVYDELNRKTAATLVVLWGAGYFGLPRLSASGPFLVTPLVALLDVALVLLVFKGNLKIG